MITKVFGLITCAALAGCAASANSPASVYTPPVYSNAGQTYADQDQANAVAHQHSHHVVAATQPAPAVDKRVEAVQRALQDRHYYWGSIDGVNGPKTKQAVSDFQKDLGVPVTGVADDKTLAALDVK
jgi:peptidoglycan hydrolase-like protein with peptidoglycan-binding domain